MAQAMIMLERSLAPGRNVKEDVQFDTVRRLCTAYSNTYHAGRRQHAQVLFSMKIKKVIATDCPTDGVWFSHFVTGMEIRMRKQIKQDLLAMRSIEVMKKAMEILEQDWAAAVTPVEKDCVVVTAMIFMGTLCWGLRGEELILISVGGTRKVWSAAASHKTRHVMLALVGKRKTLAGERQFLLPATPRTTRSGLQPEL